MSDNSILVPFCAAVGEGIRAGLERPFIIGGMEVATDGAVSVFRKTDQPDAGFPFRERTLVAARLAYAEIIDATKTGIAELPPIPPLCASCVGRLFVKCPACGGTQYDREGEECGECDDDGDIPCPSCSMRRVGVEIDGHWFDAKYLHKLSALPGLKGRVIEMKLGHALAMAWDGGWAALMEYERSGE